ncbi:MAG TPA: DUF1015 domain-containing protein [Acidobacteriota bacterium]|jgi:uncharacterized protein (DUF1015 family)|nr:DUF1015 domain-containing protein [Acidobacteriota bacterium]
MTILPLKAIRFNPIRVGNLEDVVTQPYDKIDRFMRDAYYQKSPYNIVRVIRSREVDVRGEEGYFRAGRLWNQWLRGGILVQERDPAYFLYRQKFSIEGQSYCRHALVGLLDLNKSERVLAHERTLSGPRTDRLKLIRQTESNDGLIFLVYRDHNQSLLTLAELAQDLVPLESVLDEYQTQNDIFRLDPSQCGEVASVLEKAELIIADGHHRFSVALQFMQECQSKNWKPAATESFDKRMVALVEMSDPGLVILPTHRVVFGVHPFHFQSWHTKMTETFDCRGVPDMKELLRMLKDAGPGSFGVLAVDRWLLWTRKEKPHPEDLDASILQEDILAKTLGITEQQISDESRIRYFREPAKAAQDVKLGNGQLAFFLNPTRIEQVEACARRHEVMPQKSTDFFPKMLSGMLFMKMEIDKGL